MWLFLVRNFLCRWIFFGVILISLLFLMKFRVCFSEYLIVGVSWIVLFLFEVCMLVSGLVLIVLMVRLLFLEWILISWFLYMLLFLVVNSLLCFCSGFSE